MRKNTLALAISASLLSNFSCAQEVAAQKNGVGELDAIEVTDTAFQDYIRSITNEKLEDMQATDVKDILKTMPSVVVDGAARYSQKVYVRGLEDKFANISIDGARITGQLFHHSGDQTIDAEMLKIGEVELGPNSALSGPGVINGSFVYETKDPIDMLDNGQVFGGRFALGYQSAFERRMGNLSLYGAPGEMFEYLLSGNIVDDKTVKTPDFDEDSKNSRMKSGLAKIVVKPTDQIRFDLSYNTYEDGGNRPLSGEKLGSDKEDSTYNAISRDTLTSKFTYNPNDMFDASVSIYSSKQQLDYDTSYDTWERINGKWIEYDNGFVVFPQRTYENSAKGFDIRNRSVLGNHQLTYGFESSREEQRMTSAGDIRYQGGSKDGETLAVAIPGEGKLDLLGFYFEDEIHFDNWVFHLGARYDKYTLGGLYEGDFSQFSPKAKVAFQATNELKLRAGYGRIFRGPQLGETYMLDSYNSKQSDTTKAQSGHNIEVGFDYDLSHALDADRSLLGITAYRYSVDNYAHPTKNNALASKGDMEIWGVETVFTLRKDQLSLNLSHSYADGEASNHESGEKFEPKTAKIHTFKIDADYHFSDQWAFNYNAQLVPGNKFNSEWGEVKRRGYGVHNIGATYTPTALKGAKINIGIDNVFDKKYTRHTAFGTYFGSEKHTAYEAERNFKINISYKF